MERKAIRTFEDLIVWQKAIEFVKEVYVITSQGDLRRDFGLRDQMRRAAGSQLILRKGSNARRERNICSSLTSRKGSAGETRSLLRVALEVGYFDKRTHGQLSEKVLTLSRFLFNHMSSIRSAPARL